MSASSKNEDDTNSQLAYFFINFNDQFLILTTCQKEKCLISTIPLGLTDLDILMLCGQAKNVCSVDLINPISD